jgi:hypothetical protein
MHIEIWWFLVFGVAMSAIRMVQTKTVALINRRKQSGPALTGEVETRVARIEQIVESTSYEVERIGEAQRFLTKVLTDGRQSVPAATPRRESSGSGTLS